jgi:hypothetical protein
LEFVQRHYLAMCGVVWFAIFLMGVPEVGAGSSRDMVPVGGLAVVAGFAIACLVAASGEGRAARLAVLCLASGLPLWLSGRVWLGLVMPTEWSAMLLPLSLLLILMPFLLVAHSLRSTA